MKHEIITSQDDADLAALAAVGRELAAGDRVGVPLDFKKGRWLKAISKDNIVEIGPTRPFTFDMKSYSCGWHCWRNKKLVHRLVYRPIDGWISPPRDRLPDQDKKGWPIDAKGTPKDPWQPVHSIVLKDQQDDQYPLVTFSTSSYYGSKAVGRLLLAYAREAKQHPGLMPVGLLSSHDEFSPDYGAIPAPTVTIVDWQPFGEGAAPAGSPMAMPALPAPAQPLTVVAGSTEDAMDDEIPF